MSTHIRDYMITIKYGIAKLEICDKYLEKENINQIPFKDYRKYLIFS